MNPRLGLSKPVDINYKPAILMSSRPFVSRQLAPMTVARMVEAPNHQAIATCYHALPHSCFESFAARVTQGK